MKRPDGATMVHHPKRKRAKWGWGGWGEVSCRGATPHLHAPVQAGTRPTPKRPTHNMPLAVPLRRDRTAEEAFQSAVR
jgi:hypothetical protein